MLRMVEVALPKSLHVGKPRGFREGERGRGLGEDGEAGQRGQRQVADAPGAPRAGAHRLREDAGEKEGQAEEADA